LIPQIPGGQKEPKRLNVLKCLKLGMATAHDEVY